MLRATIQGDMNGYPVTVYVYDEDFEKCNEEGIPLGPLGEIEIGMFQLFGDHMAAQSLLAPFRKKSEQAVSTEATAGQWVCPVHGNRVVTRMPENFGGKLQCSAWEEANGAPPTWANSTTPKDVRGSKRWYCKNRER